jgi:hypothetical protein
MGLLRRFALAALLAAPLAAAAGATPAKEEARERWRERLAGRHFVASVRMSYRYGSDKEQRRLSVWRDDTAGGERLMARFEEPEHLKDFAILFLEQPGRQNDYFVYQPELNRVRRISERTASEDIYGVDLEVLAFGVAQSVPTTVKSIEEVRAEDAPPDGSPPLLLRIVETASVSNQRFDERVALLEPETFLPLRVEHRRAGKTVLTAITDEVAEVQGVLTPIRMRFIRANDTEVVMQVDSVDYEQPIPGAFFSTWALVKR